MVLSPREELLKIERDIFCRNQKIIGDSIVISEPGFQQYEKTYQRAVRRYQSISSIETMLAAIGNADIIYVGDYHTCNQSQRAFLRILKEVVRRKWPFIIGLELIHEKNQAAIDAYVSGKLSEKTFLKKVGLKKHWVFDLWENFKPLFDFAIYHHAPLCGIDAAAKNASIQKRDQAAAQVIARLSKQHPDQKIFVLIGDLHLAPQHLPADVRKECKKMEVERRDLILYQNSEFIYWQLANQGLEDSVEVVQISPREFCRMHTPPVICQRSYLNWLEHEEGEIDYADAKQSFLDLVERICKFLKIDLGAAKDKVEVFTSGDLSFLDVIESSEKFSVEEIKNIKRQILLSESYYIAKTHTVYLANLSMNHAGEEAAHFIKHSCSGIEKARGLADAFYANILHEALGFFGSKIINHKRKCFHEKDFEKHLHYFQNVRVSKERRLEYETALLVNEYKRAEHRGEALVPSGVFEKNYDLFFAVTHALGYMLGDRLYYGLLGGEIYKSDLRNLFHDPWRGVGKPFQIYWQWVQKLRRVRIPKRM